MKRPESPSHTHSAYPAHPESLKPPEPEHQVNGSRDIAGIKTLFYTQGLKLALTARAPLKAATVSVFMCFCGADYQISV